MSTNGVMSGWTPTTVQVTIATGTSAVLVAVSTSNQRRAPNGVKVKAMAANTATVLIGPTGTTTATGDELSAGDWAYYPVADPSLLYGISGTSSQKVTLVY